MVRLLDKSEGESATNAIDLGLDLPAPIGPPQGWYQPCRAAFEILAVILLMIVTAPVVLAAAILVRVTSRGPAFYTQKRLGLNGREYKIFKLRSMHVHSEAESGPCWSTRRDPRITTIGRILRRTHIDELPQLWNIVRGEMSLIGPRPERPEFLDRLEKAIPGYRNRLRVRPGITGLAQVQQPADIELADVCRKQAFDLYYITSMGPWLDFRILLSTPLKMCGVPYTVISAVFAMPDFSRVEGTYQVLMTRIQVKTNPQSQLA